MLPIITDLLLMRHSLAEPSSLLKNDKHRILNSQGKRLATTRAKEIATLNLDFDIMLCSSATRCMETAKVLAKHNPIKEIHFTDKLYNTNTIAYQELLEEYSIHYKKIILLGHNSTISSLAHTYFSNLQISQNLYFNECDYLWFDFSYKTIKGSCLQ